MNQHLELRKWQLSDAETLVKMSDYFNNRALIYEEKHLEHIGVWYLIKRKCSQTQGLRILREVWRKEGKVILIADFKSKAKKIQF